MAQDSTSASSVICTGIKLEVAGRVFDGVLVMCKQVEIANGTVSGTIGDGVWPPPDLEFPEVGGDVTVAFLFTRQPAADPHIDVYPWPLSTENVPAPLLSTRLPSAERITWPVSLHAGRYVVTVRSDWQAGYSTTRAFGVEVRAE